MPVDTSFEIDLAAVQLERQGVHSVRSTRLSEEHAGNKIGGEVWQRRLSSRKRGEPDRVPRVWCQVPSQIGGRRGHAAPTVQPAQPFS